MLLLYKSLTTWEVLLFSWCRGLCSFTVLRLAYFQNPKMVSKRSIPSRHHSLSTYEVLFAALFALLVALCAGLFAVSWLAIEGSERGKPCGFGLGRDSLMNVPRLISVITPGCLIRFCALMTRHLCRIQMLLVSSLEFNSEFKHETKLFKIKDVK